MTELPGQLFQRKPNQMYAIRFHQQDRGKGMQTLIDYGCGKWGGMAGGILLVPQRDLEYLDLAGVRYDKYRMDGRRTSEDILSHWEGSVKSKTLSGEETGQPSLMKTIYQCIKEWYATR